MESNTPKKGDEEARKRAMETIAPSAGGPPPADMPPVAQVQVTGYALQRELGRGGQAVVYLAIQQSTGRKVAVKLMRKAALADERALARFKREVQVLAALDHPNIVGIVDTGTASDGSQFIVMSYVAGTALDDYVKQNQDAAHPARVLRLFLKICAAVNVAHVRGIVHRDLKPGNIRIDERGEPHILDFGLAHTALDHLAGGEGPISVTGEFLGSLPWCSPEQAQADPERIDIRSDVYSLGVILYQILTGGEFPYEVVGNIRNVLDNILNVPPTPPSRRTTKQDYGRMGLPPINSTIERIVLKALAKNREERYQSAGELGRDISDYLAGQRVPKPATRAEPAPEPVKRGKNNIALWAGLAAAAACALGAWGYVLMRTPRPGSQVAALPPAPPPPVAAATEVAPQPAPASSPSEMETPLPMAPLSMVFGTCHLDGDALALTPGVRGGATLHFGGVAWRDYDLNFQAQLNGSRGFWVETNVVPGSFCQVLMDVAEDFIGAVYRNERVGHRLGMNQHFRMEPDRWYDVKVEVRGQDIRASVDGHELVSVHDDRLTLGRMGIGTRNPAARFREMRVTAPDGTLLWNGPPNMALLGREEVDQVIAPTPPGYRITNLLAQVDPGKDGSSGTWTKDGGILSGQGPGAEMQFAAPPAGNYDYRIVFTRALGSEPIGLIASHAGHSFGWVLGGHDNTSAGFELVDGLDYNANNSTRQAPRWIENGIAHTAVLRVQGDVVTAYLDGLPAGSLKTDFTNVALPGAWHQPADLGLGIWLGGDRVEIQSADVLE